MIRRFSDVLSRPDTQEIGDALIRARVGTWRMKAEELRTIADGMKSDHGRRGMLNAAANYDRLADDAERRGRPEAPRSRPETD